MSSKYKGDIVIRDNQKYFNRLLVLLDAVVIAASYFAAWFLWLGGSVVELLPGTGILAKEIYFSVLLAVIPGYLLLYNIFDMVSRKITFFCLRIWIEKEKEL